MLRKTFCILLMYPLITFANKLPNYEAVLNTIQGGQHISAYMDLSKCTPKESFAAFYSPKAIYDSQQLTYVL